MKFTILFIVALISFGNASSQSLSNMDSIRISGIVYVANTNTEIPMAKISVRGTDLVYSTDFIGNFRFTVSKEMFNNALQLDISCFGYDSLFVHQIDVSRMGTIELKLELEPDPSVMADKIIIRDSPLLNNRIELHHTFSSNPIILYSNPIQ